MTLPGHTKAIGFLALILISGLLSACGTSGFRADVRRFHVLEAPAAERIEIEPLSGAAGIEFDAYARLLGNEFARYGYRPAEGAAPDLIARLGYDSRPDPDYHASSGPIIGLGIGGAGGHVGGGVSTTIDTSDTSSIYYRHTVTLILIKAASGERVYEGSASGYSRGPALAGVMPKLLEALFTNWPGVSGTTETIKISDQ